jgi:nucleoside 2-deoxyribosyltransferase
MVVTICSSSKFYDQVERLADGLAAKGVEVFTPRFDFSEAAREVSDHDKRWLTLEFLGKIERSTAVYVVAEGGYTGTSVCIEIGYAKALGLPIYLSAPPTEAAVAALATEIVPIEGVAEYITTASMNKPPVDE